MLGKRPITNIEASEIELPKTLMEGQDQSYSTKYC